MVAFDGEDLGTSDIGEVEMYGIEVELVYRTQATGISSLFQFLAVKIFDSHIQYPGVN